MASIHAGLIDDHQTYTHVTLAKVFDMSPDWMRQLLENQRIPHKRVGNLRFVSGQAFRLWVESAEEVGGAHQQITDQRDAATA